MTTLANHPYANNVPLVMLLDSDKVRNGLSKLNPYAIYTADQLHELGLFAEQMRFDRNLVRNRKGEYLGSLVAVYMRREHPALSGQQKNSWEDNGVLVSTLAKFLDVDKAILETQLAELEQQQKQQPSNNGNYNGKLPFSVHSIPPPLYVLEEVIHHSYIPIVAERALQTKSKVVQDYKPKPSIGERSTRTATDTANEDDEEVTQRILKDRKRSNPIISLVMKQLRNGRLFTREEEVEEFKEFDKLRTDFLVYAYTLNPGEFFEFWKTYVSSDIVDADGEVHKAAHNSARKELSSVVDQAHAEYQQLMQGEEPAFEQHNQLFKKIVRSSLGNGYEQLSAYYRQRVETEIKNAQIAVDSQSDADDLDPLPLVKPIGITGEQLETLEGKFTEIIDQKRYIAEANLRLVVSIAKKYQRTHTQFLDCIAYGSEGLETAAYRFNYERGYKFSTYATWWIRQAITRGIGNTERTIRVPIHMLEHIRAIQRTKRSLFHELGREPTLQEIAKKLEVNPERIEKALMSKKDVVSLEQQIGEEEGDTLGVQIKDPHAETDAMSQRSSIRRMIKRLSAAAKLSEREMNVLYNRFGMETEGEKQTLQALGDADGVTREAIRQIEARALEKLRKAVRNFKKITGLDFHYGEDD
ncbi:sigma-70 family RNA polymerase sigma factor [Candidatus Woesearchaeota archaeon]|nr:sigma-70 family RNA polymerase sigma factor [Candidatus Woesearchaeota archaeon]